LFSISILATAAASVFSAAKVATTIFNATAAADCTVA
jgi:hypothetical protein